jgi:hypothetical protein
MKFKQYDDGSCDVEFSFKERIVILRKGKIHMSPEFLRHFGNVLVKIVSDWNINFNEDIKKLETNANTPAIDLSDKKL